MKKEIKISQVGSKVIRQKAKKVSLPLKNEDRKVIKDLIFEMTNGKQLVGMAAPQIGISKCIFIVQPKKTEFRKRENGQLNIFINPKITRLSRKKISDFEGCGSVADANLFAKVPRSQNLDIEYFGENNEKIKKTFSGFEARIVQHEMDHLNGLVFTDRIKDMKSLMSGIEFKNMKK